MTRALERLKAAFEKPPPEFGPLAFWFWNGEIRESELDRQIGEFVDKGLHGGFMHAREGLRTPYLDERWWEVVDYSVRKGVDKGFKTWIYDEYAWPSGRAGSSNARDRQTPSRVLSAGPEHHAKSLVRNIHDAEGPVQVALEGRYPDGEPLVRLAARIDKRGALDPKTFTDLTQATSWNCPDGKWRILSFAVASFSDQIDYLRAPTVKLFIETTYEAYAERHRDEFGKGIPGVFFDEPSIAARPMPWTDALADRFKKDKGYSLLEKLPMLVLRAGPETVKVRCDFYDTVAALYEDAWFKQISAWCERHKLLWAGHTEEHVAHHAARQGDYFRTMRHVTLPGTDIHSYRYARPRTIQAAEVKSAVSIAAMLNRERVMAEAFGGAGWGVTLDEVKHGANLLAALGVDMTVMHGFHYTLESAEAADDWPNSFSFHNPYWENFGELSTYIARLSALVNQSTATTTVGVLYPITGVWANTADGRPNAVARELGQTFENLIDGLFARGVDVHVIDETFITGARLEKGVLRQGKLTIDLVILPPTPAMQRATARRLQAFANGGGRVIAVGARATGSSDAGGGDRSVTRVMRELFKRDASGKRGDKVGSGRTHAFEADDPKLMDSLRDVIDPATRIGSDATDIALASREIDGAQLAIVANSAVNEQKVTIETRATGGVELWDPETGAMSALPVRGSRTRRSFELTLPPHAAQIVVFDESAQASRASRGPRRRRGRKVGMDGDWQFVLETGLETGPGSVRRLELPVMRFSDFSLGAGRLERLRDPEYDDSDWRTIWLRNSAANIVGNWRGSWITGVRKPQGWIVQPNSDDHQRLRFTRTLSIAEPPIKAWAAFVGVDRVTVYMNGTPLGESEDWTNPVTYNIMPYLQLGENTIVADVERDSDAPISFLFESQIDLRSGESVVVVSDSSWDVQAPPAEVWTGIAYERDAPIVTWERGGPPIKPWGHIPLLSEAVRFPRTLMYRQALPVGCVGIGIPIIKGDHRVYVDVRERTPDINGIYNITTGGLLSVEIEAADFSNGILAPLTLFTRPTTIPLKPWSEIGYDWYSGTARYERTFELTAAQAEARVILSLGEVNHHAQVAVNGRDVGVRLWPPYDFDLTGSVEKGSNSVRVRVSNLLASEMRWKRDESTMGNPWHRYWHEDNIEAAALKSGLLGPVEVRVG